jgi:hypothetical protein
MIKQTHTMQLEKNNSEFILYQTEDSLTKIQVRLENETVWLTQADMVALFQSSKANISEHIKHIFEEGELNENSVVRNFRTTAGDGKTDDTKFYNLDVIISVGILYKTIKYKINKNHANELRTQCVRNSTGISTGFLFK